jgi:hypothetical protein
VERLWRSPRVDPEGSTPRKRFHDEIAGGPPMGGCSRLGLVAAPGALSMTATRSVGWNNQVSVSPM